MRNLVAALLVCLLTACGGTAVAPDDTTGASPAASAPAASAPAASAPVASAQPSPAGSTGTGGEAPEAVVSQVTQLLEQQFNVPAANITVESVEPMEWNDGALGCPKPGMMYTQAIVPGYKVTLTRGGQSYWYHTDLRVNVVPCPRDVRPLGGAI